MHFLYLPTKQNVSRLSAPRWFVGGKKAKKKDYFSPFLLLFLPFLLLCLQPLLPFTMLACGFMCRMWPRQIVFASKSSVSSVEVRRGPPSSFPRPSIPQPSPRPPMKPAVTGRAWAVSVFKRIICQRAHARTPGRLSCGLILASKARRIIVSL